MGLDKQQRAEHRSAKLRRKRIARHVAKREFNEAVQEKDFADIPEFQASPKPHEKTKD